MTGSLLLNPDFTDHPTETDELPPLEVLKERVEGRLVTRRYCIVFEKNMEGCWPMGMESDPLERKKGIEAFAQVNGWSAKINDTATRVRFKKLTAH